MSYAEREGGKPEVNEVGDTVRTSTVTDRTRARAFDRRKDVEIKTEIVRDTVYIEKRDSVLVSNTALTRSSSARLLPEGRKNPTDKKPGGLVTTLKWILAIAFLLGFAFLCRDSGKPKRAWSLLSLLHRFSPR